MAAIGTGPVGRITTPVSVNPYFPAVFAAEHERASADGERAVSENAASKSSPGSSICKLRFILSS